MMRQFGTTLLLLLGLLATPSCGPSRTASGVGPAADGGQGDAASGGSAGNDAAAPTEGGGTGGSASATGGVSGAGGALGVGGALPPSRCAFESGADSVVAAPASEAVVLRRVARFLDDAPDVVPAGVTASATTPATAAFAAGAVDLILDDHVAKSTEAAGLVRFLAVWLKLATADNPTPNVTPAHTWARKLVTANATLSTLFTAPTGEAHRNGIFTDRQLLTRYPSITTRGRWLDENVFCLPPMSDDFVGFLHRGLGADTTPGGTQRQRLGRELAHSPVCTDCHNQVDPPGFSLEHFDEMGAYRDLDSGQPVDSTGKLMSPLPALSFTSIDDMAPLMAMSCGVAYCFANAMLTDAFGPMASASGAAAPPAAFGRQEVDQVATAFVNANLSLRALVKAIVGTPSFLHGP